MGKNVGSRGKPAAPVKMNGTSEDGEARDGTVEVLPPKRIKPLAEVTWADVPPGFDPEDVATDVMGRR